MIGYVSAWLLSSISVLPLFVVIKSFVILVLSKLKSSRLVWCLTLYYLLFFWQLDDVKMAVLIFVLILYRYNGIHTKFGDLLIISIVLIGCLAFMLGLVRPHGRIGLVGPIVYGWFASLMILRNVKKNKYLLGAGLLALIFSGSKGAVLGLLLAVALKKFWMYFPFLVGSIFFALLAPFEGRTYLARAEMILESLSFFKENLIFGAGLNRVSYGLASHSYPHNLALEVAAEGGLVGLLIYFSIIQKFWSNLEFRYVILSLHFSGGIGYLYYILL